MVDHGEVDLQMARPRARPVRTEDARMVARRRGDVQIRMAVGQRSIGEVTQTGEPMGVAGGELSRS